jgi:zinc protease
MNIRRTLSALALASLLPAIGSAQALPDGKALVAKHAAAVGGRQTLDKHTSLHMTGTFSMAAMGIDGPVHVYRAKPARFLQQITLGSFGESTQGFDGTTAWAIQPMQGASVMSGDQAAQVQQSADFYSDFPDVSKYTSIETVALEDFEGRKCYKVKLVKAVGGETIQYFDAETGLAAGAVRSVDTQMGKMDITMVMSDYKDQDGYKMPTKITQKTPQGDVVLTFTAFEWDKVDAKVFDLPDAVKALVKP